MPLKCKVKAVIGVKGLQDTTVVEGIQTKFPREVGIQIYSDSRLGNWILKYLILPRKLFQVNISILGW